MKFLLALLALLVLVALGLLLFSAPWQVWLTVGVAVLGIIGIGIGLVGATITAQATAAVANGGRIETGTREALAELWSARRSYAAFRTRHAQVPGPEVVAAGMTWGTTLTFLGMFVALVAATVNACIAAWR